MRAILLTRCGCVGQISQIPDPPPPGITADLKTANVLLLEGSPLKPKRLYKLIATGAGVAIYEEAEPQPRISRVGDD
jgi:hypothetical protein